MAEKMQQGITIEWSSDTAEFDKSINNINRAINILKKDFTSFKKQLKVDPGNVSKLEEQLKNIKKQMDLVNQAIEMYRQKQNELSLNGPMNDEQAAEYTRLAKSIIDAEDSLRSLENQEEAIGKQIEYVNSGLFEQDQRLQKAAEQWKTYGNALRMSGESLENVGRALAPVSAAAGAGLVGAVKAAQDFESALTGVYKTVDETPTTSYERIEETIRKMATELPTTANEIAGIMEMAGQLGVKADDLEKFTKVMIDLSNATNIVGDEGAAAIAQFYNVMQGDLDTVDRFGSTITMLGNNSATTEADIMYMAKALSAMGGTLKLSEAEVLGLATTLSSVGLSAERGGSAISTIFRKVHTDVAGVGDAAEEHVKVWADLLGVTENTFKELWNTQRISTMREMIGALATTADEGGNLFAILNDLGISNIRQVDSITRLTNAYAKFDEYMNMANEEWERNTALTIEANRRYGTTESQIKVLRNNVTELGITLGKQLLPILVDVVDRMKPIVKSLTEFAEGNGKLIASILALTASLSPALITVGRLTKGVGNAALAVSKYATLAKESTGATRTLALAMMNGTKFGLYGGLAAVTLGLGALAAAMVYNNQEVVKFRRSLNNLSNDLAHSQQQSMETYRAREYEIESAMYYAKEIDKLSEALKTYALNEEETNELTDKRRAYIERLNQVIGEEVYSIDESTGQLLKNGEAVDQVANSYANLAEQMKKQAWVDANANAYADAINAQYEAMNLLQDAGERYANSISNIDYNGIKVGDEFINAAQQYLNGEIENIQVLQDILTSNSDFMNMLSATGTDVGTATTAILNQMKQAQSDYNTEIAMTAQKIQEAKTFQEMYDAVLAAEPSQLQSIIGQYMAMGTQLDGSKTKLDLMKTAFIQARDALKAQGLDTTQYDMAIAKLDEEMLKDNEATTNEMLNDDESSSYKQMKADENMAYILADNELQNATELANNQATSDTSAAYAKTVADQVMAYINSLKIDPKNMDIYVNIIGGEELGMYSGGFQAGGYGGGQRSGGFASGGYTVNLETNINMQGTPTITQARTFAMQMVDIVNEELGKRLKYE